MRLMGGAFVSYSVRFLFLTAVAVITLPFLTLHAAPASASTIVEKVPDASFEFTNPCDGHLLNI